MIRITTDDKRWLQKNQPGIVVVSDSAVEGNFRIRAVKGDGIFQFVKCPTCKDGDGFVNDRFRIHAYFAGDMPRVFETGGRFEGIARENHDRTGKPLEECLFDLHVYGDGRLCLGHPANIPIIMQKHPGIQGVFDNLLSPYFYFHAYWAKYGKPPWHGLHHNLEIATLESIYFSRDNDDELNACLQCAKNEGWFGDFGEPDALQKRLCMCDSGKHMSECDCYACKGARIFVDKNPWKV